MNRTKSRKIVRSKGKRLLLRTERIRTMDAHELIAIVAGAISSGSNLSDDCTSDALPTMSQPRSCK